MIKKVTIFGLLGIVLFGISAPVIASLIPQPRDCCMSCCQEKQHQSKEYSCSTDMTPPPMNHQQFAKEPKQPDCPLLTSCLPKEIPSGLEIQSEAPAFKSKLKYNVNYIIIHFTLSNNSVSIFSGHFPQIVPLVNSARDILTTHSILII